jgi:hypothetical protein
VRRFLTERRHDDLVQERRFFPTTIQGFPAGWGSPTPPSCRCDGQRPQFRWPRPASSRRSFRRLAHGVSWRGWYMEVFAAFFVILLAGMALPVVLLISGVLFDLVVAIYVVIATIFSRKRKPGALGAVRRSGRAKKTLGTVVVWEY